MYLRRIFFFFTQPQPQNICVDLSFTLTSDPCSSQIYAQMESQRAGYIELALQAYEQTTATGTAA